MTPPPPAARIQALTEENRNLQRQIAELTYYRRWINNPQLEVIEP